MSAFQTVDYQKQGDVALVTLRRPDVINAFNVQMRDDLYEVMQAVRDDSEVRGILLSGAGEGGFCAGADLTEFGSAPSQAVAREVRWERDLWGLMRGITKPSVASIHGYCLGSGVEIACLCDIRVCSDDAMFGMPEVGFGLVPAAVGTQTLPRTLGQGRALELLMTGRRFNADEAHAYGLVSEVVPRVVLRDRAVALLTHVLDAPDNALSLAKRAVTEGADLSVADGLALEARLSQQLI
jgi:enoyl-CoA hydratase/carnithine racemase